MIKLENITYAYKKDLPTVLQDVSLDIEPGQFVAIMGKNGSGKSTLTKCLTGLITPQQGSIKIENKSYDSLKQRDLAKYISYVPQSCPTNTLSVYDNVMIGRRPHISISPTAIDHKFVEKSLITMNIVDIAYKQADNISGGEFQKMCIARSLAQDTKIIIMDEPTNNLDIANINKFLGFLQELIKKDDKTILCVLHDINCAMRYADTIVFLKDGKIVAQGDKSIVNKDLIDDVFECDSHFFTEKGQKYIIV